MDNTFNKEASDSLKRGAKAVGKAALKYGPTLAAAGAGAYGGYVRISPAVEQAISTAKRAKEAVAPILPGNPDAANVFHRADDLTHYARRLRKIHTAAHGAAGGLAGSVATGIVRSVHRHRKEKGMKKEAGRKASTFVGALAGPFAGLAATKGKGKRTALSALGGAVGGGVLGGLTEGVTGVPGISMPIHAAGGALGAYYGHGADKKGKKKTMKKEASVLVFSNMVGTLQKLAEDDEPQPRSEKATDRLKKNKYKLAGKAATLGSTALAAGLGSGVVDVGDIGHAVKGAVEGAGRTIGAPLEAAGKGIAKGYNKAKDTVKGWVSKDTKPEVDGEGPKSGVPVGRIAGGAAGAYMGKKFVGNPIKKALMRKHNRQKHKVQEGLSDSVKNILG